MTRRSSGGARDSWLGFPRRLSEDEAALVIDDLDHLWTNQMGSPLGPIDKDLEGLKVLFDPIARGLRLRDRLGELEFIEVQSDLLSEPFIISIRNGRSAIVTPEGRELLELLITASSGTETPVISSSQIAYSESKLLALYRSWSQQRLRDVIGLQQGSAPPLLPQAIGQVLLLLVNGSTSRERAIRRPDSDEDLRDLDDALSTVVEAFADTLSPPKTRPRNRSHYSIIGGYSLSEARRRLGSSLVIDQNEVYLTQDLNLVVERIATELARRSDINETLLASAFDAALVAYESVRPTLASFGVAHSRPSAIRKLRHDLLTQYKSAQSRPRQTTSPTD